MALNEYDGRANEGCRVDAIIDWAKGEINHEIRRIAGLTPDPGEVIDRSTGEGGLFDWFVTSVYHIA